MAITRKFGLPVHLYPEREQTADDENPAWFLHSEGEETPKVLHRVLTNQISEATIVDFTERCELAHSSQRDVNGTT